MRPESTRPLSSWKKSIQRYGVWIWAGVANRKIDRKSILGVLRWWIASVSVDDRRLQAEYVVTNALRLDLGVCEIVILSRVDSVAKTVGVSPAPTVCCGLKISHVCDVRSWAAFAASAGGHWTPINGEWRVLRPNQQLRRFGVSRAIE